LSRLALSTFWMSGRDWRLLDLFSTGMDLGFESYELSGIHQDTFYDEIQPGDYKFASLHDPSPATRGHARLGSKELRRADVVCTSLDSERRRQATAITKNSIDVAARFGASAIVLHVGQTGASPAIEEKLKELFQQSRIAGPEANALRAQLAVERAYQHQEHMDALHRSLDELAAYAAARKVILGIENRPTNEITNFAEMGEILSWYPADIVGYWHDTGHAQVQANIGMAPHIDWLRAYSSRIVGMHLHDAVGIDYHLAPGGGDVDWIALASLVPPNAIRILEVDRRVSGEAIRLGVQHLRTAGWLPE
jgi:sugar phosphate isomerase/epimerase